MYRLFASFGLLLVFFCSATAQPTDGLLRLDDPVHVFLERQQTLGRLPNAHLTALPLSSYDAAAYLDSLSVNAALLNATEKRWLAHTQNPEPKRSLPFGLYGDNRTLFSAAGADFGLQVSPLLDLQLGYSQTGISTVWTNVRGVRVAGHIGDHVFFETSVEEVQSRDPFPSIQGATLPRERRVNFLTGSFDDGNRPSTDGRTNDFGRARGLVGARSKHFEVRFGRTRNHWGGGLNSLWLSNFAPVYDQLQIRTTFWRIQYVNLFTAMEDGSLPVNGVVPRKYGAMHQLSFNATDRLQFQLFEGVIFQPDTVRASRGVGGYDLAFLNPLIFYHQAEKEHGALGNANVGAGVSWIARPGFRVYGQGLLTELVVAELFGGRGCWCNKWGVMAGTHVVPRADLDVQLEYARIRPFTYSHKRDSNEFSSSYTHYLDPLGYAGGQNLREFSGRLNWTPTPVWRFTLIGIRSWRGLDDEGKNFGADPNVAYTSRFQDFDNEVGQGLSDTATTIEAVIDYSLLPDLTLSAYVYGLDSERFDDVFTVRLGLRWGLPATLSRF